MHKLKLAFLGLGLSSAIALPATGDTLLTGNFNGQNYSLLLNGVYTVPADSGGPSATFNNSSAVGMNVLTLGTGGTLNIEGGQFDSNGNYGLNFIQDTAGATSAVNISGGDFSNNGYGIVANDPSVQLTISGGNFSGNKTGGGILFESGTATVTGGTFSNNGDDFVSESQTPVEIYGSFNGLNPGDTEIINGFNGVSEIFTGQLENSSAPQTFRSVIAVAGAEFVLNDVAVPEPATVSLLAAFAGLAMVRRRRR